MPEPNPTRKQFAILRFFAGVLTVVAVVVARAL